MDAIEQQADRGWYEFDVDSRPASHARCLLEMATCARYDMGGHPPASVVAAVAVARPAGILPGTGSSLGLLRTHTRVRNPAALSPTPTDPTAPIVAEESIEHVNENGNGNELGKPEYTTINMGCGGSYTEGDDKDAIVTTPLLPAPSSSSFWRPTPTRSTRPNEQQSIFLFFLRSFVNIYTYTGGLIVLGLLVWRLCFPRAGRGRSTPISYLPI